MLLTIGSNLTMRSGIVVYSGGLDSYTLLNKALDEFERVEAITFDYGQKHSKEITFASKVCSENAIAHEVVNLDLEKILSGLALVELQKYLKVIRTRKK